MDAAQFEAAMRNQLQQYAGRRISNFLYHGGTGEAERAQVLLDMNQSFCAAGFCDLFSIVFSSTSLNHIAALLSVFIYSDHSFCKILINEKYFNEAV